MIIRQDFEALVNANGATNCDIKSLLTTSKNMTSKWADYIIDNEVAVNFNIDTDINLNYLTVQGEQRKVDISEFAFGQLCARLGVPAGYVRKCIDNGKISLALDNFHAWAGEMNKNMLVREYEGVARAVLSDSYSPFDSHKVLKSLNNTIDDAIYKPTQVLLSTDRLHLRFINRRPLTINDGSPLYAGFTVDSSDVGRGSLNMKFFIYREVCTNGLVISKMGGTLFRQNHIGSNMTGGKLELFSRAIMNIDKLSAQATTLIKENKSCFLKDYELEMYLEKAKRELKLSEKSEEKLVGLIHNTYGNTRWGIINSVTELAQDFTLDTRIDYENWAGDLFAKAA